MARFVILVQFKVDPSRVAAFRQEMVDAAAWTRNTPGNRGFDVNQDPLDPTRFMLYEVFEDESAWQAHHARRELQEHLDRIKPMLAANPERRVWSRASA